MAEKCPLRFPQSKEIRHVRLISLKKNEWWIDEKDIPWIVERMRTEKEMAGVPLVENPDEDLSAVAETATGSDSQHGSDSQQSLLSTDSQGAETDGQGVQSPAVGRSAQGTVDVGYTCRWTFPTKVDAGGWTAEVTRECDKHGYKVECKMAKFTKAKWKQVYGQGIEAPNTWSKATPTQKKEACRLYVEAFMAKALEEAVSQPPP